MKGYELIVLANGVLLLVVGLLVLLDGLTIQGHGADCIDGNRTRCDRQLEIGHVTRLVAPYLFGAGALLLGLGTSLVLYRRSYRPPTDDPGPGSP